MSTENPFNRPHPPQENTPRGKWEEKKLPRMLATEWGLVVDTPDNQRYIEDMDKRIKEMSFQKIDALVTPRIYPSLKREPETIMEIIEWKKYKKESSPSDITSTEWLNEQLFEAQEELHAFDKMRSKIHVRKEPLSFLEISRLLAYVARVQYQLDEAVYRQEMRHDGEECKNVKAAAIFLHRKQEEMAENENVGSPRRSERF